MDFDSIHLPAFRSQLVHSVVVDECVAVKTSRTEAKEAGMPASTQFAYCAVRDPCAPLMATEYFAWKLPELGLDGTHLNRPPVAGQYYWIYADGKSILDVPIASLAQLATKETVCSQ